MKKDTIIILNDKVVCFDVDDTLVMWNPDGISYYDDPDAIEVPCPSSSYGPYSRQQSFWLKPHKKHIQKLKGYARSGWFVIIWSAGGGPWARNVANTLGLTEYADLIIGKPSVCFDDLPVGEAIGQRKYYQDKKS